MPTERLINLCTDTDRTLRLFNDGNISNNLTIPFNSVKFLELALIGWCVKLGNQIDGITLTYARILILRNNSPIFRAKWAKNDHDATSFDGQIKASP